jgi:UDP-N-acetylglucosamine transferase subunit ALG13
MDKTELIVVALQQRMGEMVSNYELQIAMLRAEITELVEDRNAKEKAIEEYSASLSQICD